MRASRALHACLVTVALFAVVPSSRALAHGAPPEALEPLIEEQGSPTLVRLSAGLAERRADGAFAFVCPAEWDGSGSDSMAARSDGLLAIATSEALVLRVDREFRRHPASAGARAVGVASSGEQLYALLERDGQYEVSRVERDGSEVLWRDPGPWFGIGAAGGFVQLVALEGSTVREALVPTDAGAAQTAQAQLVGDVLTVQARPLRAGAYLVLRSASGVGHSLARFDRGELLTLLSAASSIAGPVENAAGEAWMAIDGDAARFVAGLALPQSRGEFVSRVSCSSASCYATVRAGLSPLGRADAQLSLSLAAVVAPDFDRVPIVRREECRAQWEDWQFDLVAANIVAPDAADAGADAGAEANASMDAGVAPADARIEPEPRDASAIVADAALQKPAAEGCSLSSGRVDSRALLASFSLALYAWTRKRLLRSG